ncbi:MAG TPA: CapA family protein, partial [Candidatus Cloacimonadota bacterium]|nr:CapA family protein [Candidatus Cloacimonadota bacterium]
MKTKFMLLIIIICHLSLNAVNRGQLIESFDDAQTELFTYQNFDNVNYWEHSSSETYNSSPYSLYLKGNNSKFMMTDSIFTDGSTVWSLAARVNLTGNAIAFGVGDGINSLIYIIKGGVEADSMNWVEDYQGAFPNNEWCQYLLPLGEDWYARFDYYPVINRLFFINQGNGKVFFDEIYDVSEDIIPAPIPGFRYYISNRQSDERSVRVQFNSVIHNQNPDETYTWYWQFGDGNTSTEEHPVHIYNNCNQEVFKVLLTVESSSGKRGFTTEDISYEAVANILPSSINFVGDVMLARTVGNIDPQLVFDSVRDILVSADLSVANLESSLSNANTPHPTKPIRFQANPVMVNALTDAGIDIVSLANNHIYDYLYNGISQTQQVLSDNDILYSGAGINEYEASLPL